MDKKEIVKILEEKHQILFDWLQNQPEEIWEKAPEGKWTTAQQIQHLVDSLQLLNNALSYPRFFLKHKFGLCNRETRDYDFIVKNYQKKLIENKDQAAFFNRKLKKPVLKNRERLLNRLQIQNKKLQYKVNKISDLNLDTLVIPHPLMGKMTIREIVMWTAYHTEHHTNILKEKYSNIL
ncbi:DinB family protein [Polaribacter aestuariivivens]|uniref:DinB family protein n=1 Tax=Polaribacter aestuariivivens TaxID=2304626 RepID=A0A5S3N7Y0_9FLAO|nr:DinB family protein [Polaribacter aestuariivivens]TMM31423.1 DinB family protein [Polaribacter aestuariivivens]